MQQLKVRASSASQIMGVKGLGQTGRTFVENWYKEQLYSRRKTFTSPAMEKGTEQEDVAIALIAEHYGYGLLTKNEEWFENDFMTGTPDLILNDRIIDIKCSWSAFTFPLFSDHEDTYDYQMQCYMALTGKPMAQVIFCLMDGTDKYIDGEALKQARALGLDDVPIELYEAIKADCTYSHLPNSLRIKEFTVKRDEAVIEKIQNRVMECRDYLNTILLTLSAEPERIPEPVSVTKSTVNKIGGLELNW